MIAITLLAAPIIGINAILIDMQPHAPVPAPMIEPITPEPIFLALVLSKLTLKIPILSTNPVSAEIITTNEKLKSSETGT